MKKITMILMAFVMMFFTQCRPEPETDNTNTDTDKVRVRCSISMNKGDRSDFTNLMDEGKVNWSDGRECVYVAIPGDTPTVIELESWADGNPSHLVFSGEAAKGLIQMGEQYEVWYFGHSQQSDEPYVRLVDGSRIEGSIAGQSGRLEDLGYCHIAKTTVTAESDGEEVVLNLNATLVNQMAIALLDLEDVGELYGSAIKGTEYALAYDEAAGVFGLEVTEAVDARINVQPSEGISYVFMFPNEAAETQIRCKRGGKTYAYTFHKAVKANKVYFKTAADGVTKEALEWTECEDENENVINGHEFVDLGLPSGLLWATCNVGAILPEEYGDYFAWGETSTKENFSDCPTVGLSISELQSQGYIDSEGNLTSQYDAATANWGGTWRMPTKEEQEELLNNCTWTWMTQNGVNGYKVEGQNDNSIFLPAAGRRDGSVLDYAGGIGSYWSSTPIESYGDVYYLYFDSSDHDMEYYFRYFGHSVRPVVE